MDVLEEELDRIVAKVFGETRKLTPEEKQKRLDEIRKNPDEHFSALLRKWKLNAELDAIYLQRYGETYFGPTDFESMQQALAKAKADTSLKMEELKIKD